MIILNVLLIIFCLLIIPEIIGLLFTKFLKEEKNNAVFAFVIGQLTIFSICQLLAVPMIIAGAKFTTLLYTYIIIIITLFMISLFINKKRLKNIAYENFIYLKKMPKVLTIILMILIVMQVGMLVKYAHIDDDDSFYVGTATTTVQTNSLFKYDASDGHEYQKLLVRYVIGPFPVYIALISSFINIHPAIVAHTILPIILIPLVYIIYGLIARELFNKNKKSIILFLIILCFVYIWGNYTKRTNFTFLLFRIWQGKAVLANIIIPSVWLFFIKAVKNNFKFIDIILLIIVILSGILTTTMGIGLPAISLMLLSFIFAIKDKKISYLIKSGICCLPCLIYLALYFIV